MNVWLSGEGCQILILTPDTLLVTRSQLEMSSARTRRGRRKWKLRAEQWRADQWHVRGWGPAGGWETHCHVWALTMPHYDWECRHRAGTMSLPGSAAHKHSHLWHSAKQFISQNFSESMQRADDCVLKAFVTVKRSPIAILHSLQLRVTRNRRATVRIISHISHTIDTQCIKLPGFGFSSDSFCGGLSFYLDNNTLNSCKLPQGHYCCSHWAQTSSDFPGYQVHVDKNFPTAEWYRDIESEYRRAGARAVPGLITPAVAQETQERPAETGELPGQAAPGDSPQSAQEQSPD